MSGEMVGTLTFIFVVLSLLALALIGFVIYLVIGTNDGSAPRCPGCGGTRRTVVYDRAGVMSTRCPICDR